MVGLSGYDSPLRTMCNDMHSGWSLICDVELQPVDEGGHPRLRHLRRCGSLQILEASLLMLRRMYREPGSLMDQRSPRVLGLDVL